MIEDLVSIVLPIYNMEQYLGRCLESISSQTYELFEVIMVDDGSTDKSSEIARAFLADERFKYVYQQNSGVSVARNMGIELANGRWIAFIDPDDYISNDYLEQLLTETQDHNADIISCCCKCVADNKEDIIHFYDGDHTFSGDKKVELLKELIDINYNSHERRKTAIGVPWGKLYRRELLVENDLVFDKELTRYQDNIFNMYVFDKAKAIKYIDKALYIYNEDHISNYDRKYHPKAHIFLDRVCNLRRNYLCEKGYFDDCEIYRLYCKEVKGHCNTMLKKFFLNERNTVTVKERCAMMKAFFSGELYREALSEKTGSLGSRVSTFRIWLLTHRMYLLLVFTNSLACKLYRMRGAY